MAPAHISPLSTNKPSPMKIPVVTTAITAPAIDEEKGTSSNSGIIIPRIRQTPCGTRTKGGVTKPYKRRRVMVSSHPTGRLSRKNALRAFFELTSALLIHPGNQRLGRFIICCAQTEAINSPQIAENPGTPLNGDTMIKDGSMTKGV